MKATHPRRHIEPSVRRNKPNSIRWRGCAPDFDFDAVHQHHDDHGRSTAHSDTAVTL